MNGKLLIRLGLAWEHTIWFYRNILIHYIYEALQSYYLLLLEQNNIRGVWFVTAVHISSRVIQDQKVSVRVLSCLP
jgi:hypothetical protein